MSPRITNQPPAAKITAGPTFSKRPSSIWNQRPVSVCFSDTAMRSVAVRSSRSASKRSAPNTFSSSAPDTLSVSDSRLVMSAVRSCA